MSILPIYSELVRPNKRRIKKVIYRSSIIVAIFYVAIAGCGYFSTFNYTGNNLIQRKPLPGFKPDYLFIVSAVAICLVLFSAFATNYGPTRQQIFLVLNDDV